MQGNFKLSLLIVAPDSSFRQSLVSFFNRSHVVKVADSIWNARTQMDEMSCDVMISELILPDGSVFDLIDYFDGTKKKPLMIVSAEKAEKIQLINCLNGGVNGFLERPFSPEDLELIIQKKLANVESRDKFKFNPVENSFEIDNKKYHLTDIEYRIMSYLIFCKGAWVPRQRLVQEVWGDQQVSRNTLDTHITNLKAKINNFNKSIKNIRGKGFSFDVDQMLQ